MLKSTFFENFLNRRGGPAEPRSKETLKYYRVSIVVTIFIGLFFHFYATVLIHAI